MADELWSKEFPKKAGWFFMRTEGEEFVADGLIVWVGHNSSGVRHEGKFFYSDHAWLQRREFLGPITPADAEQLVSLRDAAQAALRCLQGTGDKTIGQVKEMLHATLNPKG